MQDIKNLREIDRKLIASVEALDLDRMVECLENGANINAQDEDGLTPVHCAAGLASSHFLGVLARYGSLDLSVRDNEGRTPIDVARQFSNPRDPDDYFSRAIDVMNKASDAVGGKAGQAPSPKP